MLTMIFLSTGIIRVNFFFHLPFIHVLCITSREILANDYSIRTKLFNPKE